MWYLVELTTCRFISKNILHLFSYLKKTYSSLFDKIKNIQSSGVISCKKNKHIMLKKFLKQATRRCEHKFRRLEIKTQPLSFKGHTVSIFRTYENDMSALLKLS